MSEALDQKLTTLKLARVRECPGYLARPFVKKAASLAFHTIS